MKLIIITIVAMIACATAASVFDSKLDTHWTQYKLKHRKEYPSIRHEIGRRIIWENNLKHIQKHNLEYDLGHHTYHLGMNHFGDMTHEEFLALVNGYNKTKTMTKSKQRPSFLAPSNVKIPDSVDWRSQGYVTPVKDQGQCGSCWSFSAVASLEGQNFKKTGKLVSLSEQNLVDCSQSFGNNGCNGGLMDYAFEYIESNKGLDTEASYPYTAQDGSCKFNPANVGATDVGFVDIPSQDEDALTSALATVGPISVAIDASHYSFQL